MGWKFGSAALLALATAAWAAPAAAQSTISFRINGVELQAPTPAGYCRPKGKQIDAARLIASGDPDNVTHLTLVSCDEATAFQDYLMLKTPSALLPVTMERPQLLEMMGAAFESPEFTAALNSGQLAAEAERSQSQALGTAVDFSGEVKPRGKDDVCAYLGGIIQVQAAGQSAKVAVAACFTGVAGRAVTINWYGPDKGAAGVADLLMRSKRLAMSMTGKPVR